MEKAFKIKIETEISFKSISPKGYSYESRKSQAILNYRLILDFVPWGIDLIRFDLPDQEINFDIEVLKDTEENPEIVSFNLKIEGECELPRSIITNDACPRIVSLEIKEINQVGSSSFEGSAKALLSF